MDIEDSQVDPMRPVIEAAFVAFAVRVSEAGCLPMEDAIPDTMYKHRSSVAQAFARMCIMSRNGEFLTRPPEYDTVESRTGAFPDLDEVADAVAELTLWNETFPMALWMVVGLLNDIMIVPRMPVPSLPDAINNLLREAAATPDEMDFLRRKLTDVRAVACVLRLRKWAARGGIHGGGLTLGEGVAQGA